MELKNTAGTTPNLLYRVCGQGLGQLRQHGLGWARDLGHPLSGVSTRRLSVFGVAHHATLHEGRETCKMLDQPAHCRSGDEAVEKKWTRLFGEGGRLAAWLLEENIGKLVAHAFEDGYKLKRLNQVSQPTS